MSVAARAVFTETRFVPPPRLAAPTLVPAGNPDAVTLVEFLHRAQLFGVRQSLPRNHTIFSEGDSTDQVYELVSGTVRLAKHTPGGRRHILDFVIPGEVFGLLEHSEHTVTAEAVTDVVLISYSRSRLDKLAAGDPVLRRRILSAVSDDLLTAQQQLLILGCQDAREKMASFFLRLSGRAGLKNGARLALPMGRQDIADHLGLTIETVCRTIRAFHRAGIATVPNVNEIVLTNLPALRALAVEV
ncbi:MAG TPA: cyclic nucleotide-binding domain-containing protein [Rhizomicrobium sp.]|jgi:CRP/FNR family nitrogen fixation transcriptional regulator|nr:cyclic nucleotide-binding domain-containing protein [Rhizomicrobium sp.]